MKQLWHKLLWSSMIALTILSLFGGSAVQAQSDESTRRAETDQVISHLGILLLYVKEGSPADSAGLQSGDIVLAVNGLPVERVRGMLRILDGIEPGDALTLVVRSGQEVKFARLVVGDRGHGRAYFGVLPVPVFGQRTTLGELANTANEAGVSSAASCSTGYSFGYSVVEVVDDGPAALAGLQAGDQIISLQGEPIVGEETIDALTASGQPGDNVTMGVLRPLEDGSGNFAQLDLTLIFAPHPEEDRVYWGMAIAPVEPLILSGCITEEGASTSASAAEETSRGGQPEEGDSVVIAPVPTIDPPAGMENCVHETTWGFGITDVLPDTPAAQAGLAANDVIVTIDGVEIPPAVQAESLFAGYVPGDEVTLRVVRPSTWRGDPSKIVDPEFTLVLGERAQTPGRAFLGVMGVAVKMGEAMVCSATAQAEPVIVTPRDEDNANVDGEVHQSGEKGVNIPKTRDSELAPAASVTATLLITPSMVITPGMVAAPDGRPGDGLWLWCPLEDGVFRCRYPADLENPISLEPGELNAMPVAPTGVSGGAILPGNEITVTETITPIQIAPLEELPEQPLYYCWTGEGFELCPDLAPVGPIAPGPTTDPGEK